jgi:hypothetical protein
MTQIEGHQLRHDHWGHGMVKVSDENLSQICNDKRVDNGT